MSISPNRLEEIVRDVVRQHLPNLAPQPSPSAPSKESTAASTCELSGARSFKKKLAAGEVTYGLWITLESPSLTEIAARLGFDWIVIDAEHGHLDLRVVMEHIRVANLSGLTAFVRVSDIHKGLIKRIMDIGADGILVPQARSADEISEAVKYAKYPPDGIRGIGAERSTRWALNIESCVQSANDQTLVIPLLETAEAGDDLDRILELPGIDALFLGPHDFAATSGHPGTAGHPDVSRRLSELRHQAKAAGKPLGIVAFALEDIARRRDEGFTMIGLGFDTGFFIRAAQAALEHAGKPVSPEAWY